MNTPSSQVGASPRENDHRYSTTPQARHVPAVAESTTNPHCRAAHSLYEDAGPRNAYSNMLHEGYVSANEFNQYYDFDLQERHAQPQQAAIAGSPPIAGSDYELLHGIANYAQASSPHPQHREASSLPPHHALSPSAVHPSPESVLASSSSRGMSYPPQLMDEHQHSPHEDDIALPRQSRYEPFQHRFHDAEQAREHRRRGTRFDRIPYCSPVTDDTIAEVERKRPHNVMRIYNAMTSGEVARDNPGSIAMKRWVNDAHYPPDLVEAYAHKVFDCLMQQVKDGFRGWMHNDYVADERKGDDIDKDVDCAGRLENIILALSQEKTICEDVMNSACQIRMFVNAPRAYSNRKHQNRIGNSKRGRTKDTPDPNPKPGKARRTATGRVRAQSSSMSTLHASRESTPQQPQQPQTLQRPSIAPPYYRPSAPQQLSPSPNFAISYPAQPTPHGLPLPPQRPSMSAQRPSFTVTQHGPITMSQPISSPQMLQLPQSHIPRMATESPQPNTSSHFTLPSSSPFPGLHPASAPASPDEVKPMSTETFSNPAATFEPHLDMHPASWLPSGAVIDPTLSPWDLPLPKPSDAGASIHADMFADTSASYVNMSQIEGLRVHSISGPSEPSGFEEFWRANKGVQEFPSPKSTSGGVGEQRGS